jgi:hypothetical protein
VSSKFGHFASADTLKFFNLPVQGMTTNAVRHALGRVGLAVEDKDRAKCMIKELLDLFLDVVTNSNDGDVWLGVKLRNCWFQTSKAPIDPNCDITANCRVLVAGKTIPNSLETCRLHAL